jgi:SAM-dependent methyltransferase
MNERKIDSDINQHQVEIEINRQSWTQKPLLRKIYRGFYETIASRLSPGITLELGSGIGQIKEFIPKAITSDLYPGPGIDQVESAYQLSFPNNSVDNIILFDVWHHLKYPGLALLECKRVLKEGGRILIFEPAMGLFPRIIYYLFHHEPIGYLSDITWLPKPGEKFNPQDYFASQARAWKIFYNKNYQNNLADLTLVECKTWSDFCYLGSGGFSNSALYPERLYSTISQVDKILTKISSYLFAARMLVVLQNGNSQPNKMI